jgi:ankyrin repeat protein
MDGKPVRTASASPACHIDLLKKTIFEDNNLGHLAIVKLLVEAGADVNSGIECNYFPLLIALRNNHQDIYNYLYPLTPNLYSLTEKRKLCPCKV